MSYLIFPPIESDVSGTLFPFDETPQLVYEASKVVNTSSIDTSGFDAYRQGIELVLDKHYQMGIVKIHSGEEDRRHRLRQTEFGRDSWFLTPYSTCTQFEELDYFDSVSYIEAQDDPFSLRNLRYPIVSSDVDESESYVTDGVIEPLTIRHKVTFNSIEFPFESHDVWGEAGSGNVDQTRSTDDVQSIFEYDTNYEQVPYCDMVDMLGNVPTMGYFLWDKAPFRPFNDRRDKKGTKISSESEEMRDQIEDMSPNTESMIWGNYVSTTCGFTYDGVSGIGTDSLSFGGYANDKGRKSYTIDT